MKKIFTLLAFISLNISALFAQTQDWAWIKQYYNSSYIDTKGVKADPSGNVYMMGEFTGTASFDSFILTSKYRAIFIVKFDSLGKVKWAKNAGRNRNLNHCYGIAVDKNGNAYITGYYQDTISFGTKTLILHKYDPIFITKYDPNGNVIWAKNAVKQVSGGSYSSLSTDQFCNVYLTSSFSSTPVYVDNIRLDATGTTNLVVAKFDSFGNALWAKTSSGSTVVDAGTDITNDVAGNTYVTGYFTSGNITFGSYTLTNFNYTHLKDLFIVKYDPSGNVLWAQSAGGNDDDEGTGISTDPYGNVLLEGWFKSQTVVFGSFTLNNPARTAKYCIVKYDSSGKVIWAKMGGKGSEVSETFGFASDVAGNSYVMGVFITQTFTVDSITLLNQWWYGSGLGEEFFIVKYDASGKTVWAKNLDGNSSAGYGSESGISIDKSFNIYTVGQVNGLPDTTTFGKIKVLSEYPYSFLAKLGSCQITTPVILSTGDSSFCIGDSVVLSTNPAASYMWSEYSKSKSIVVKSSGVYWVTITNSNSCMATSAPLHVTVDSFPPDPVITPAGSMSICEGDSLKLSSSPAYRYLWSDFSTTKSIYVKKTGKYWVQISDSIGCKSTSLSVNVRQNPSPHASFSVNDTDQCITGNKFILTNHSGITTGSLKYKWYFGDSPSAVDTNLPHTYTKPGVYSIFLTAKSDSGCKDSVHHFIYVRPIPTLNLGNDTTLKDNQSITLKPKGSFDSYLWSTGDTSHSIVVDFSKVGYATKAYWLKVKSHDCEATDTILITFIKHIGIDQQENNLNSTIFPNPFQTSLNIKITGISQSVGFIILDARGKFCLEIQTEPGNNGINKQIDLSGYSPGIYFLKINSESFVKTIKLVKTGGSD